MKLKVKHPTLFVCLFNVINLLNVFQNVKSSGYNLTEQIYASIQLQTIKGIVLEGFTNESKIPIPETTRSDQNFKSKIRKLNIKIQKLNQTIQSLNTTLQNLNSTINQALPMSTSFNLTEQPLSSTTPFLELIELTTSEPTSLQDITTTETTSESTTLEVTSQISTTEESQTTEQITSPTTTEELTTQQVDISTQTTTTTEVTSHVNSTLRVNESSNLFDQLLSFLSRLNIIKPIFKTKIIFNFRHTTPGQVLSNKTTFYKKLTSKLHNSSESLNSTTSKL